LHRIHWTLIAPKPLLLDISATPSPLDNTPSHTIVMSRIQQDQFVDDDEDECCPLCVEEFDLSDRNFRPCPCGYQVRCLENSVELFRDRHD
jgi:hypothetical protein